jgi:hypothetical protein
MKVLFATTALVALATAASALAQPAHDHSQHQAAPAPAAATDPHAEHAPTAAPADPHAGHDMSGAMEETRRNHGQLDHAMRGPMGGALGTYPMGREASGTAWQPDVSSHAGLHAMRGDWMLMGHVLMNGVYDWQEGPRGDEKGFVSGMVMGMARRELESGDALQFRAMLSPDPFMGKRGYPILLASGETADGVAPLVDRQHPHDLFMELSASYSHRLSDANSVFLYAGLPGEPAFGPPAFMHRLSILDSPEAPISHHWLDSTHIVFGVVTAGVVHDRWKVEVSRFKGREPDEHRYNIESPKLDSTAVRLSWNPTDNLSLQASWAEAKSVEQLEPDEDATKWSASAIYTVPVGADGWWSTTAAWGRRSAAHGEQLDAYVLESAVKPNDAWTVFARAERTQNNELDVGAGHHGETFTVSKASIGAIRDWRMAPRVKVGLGALYAQNFVPAGLEASYGGHPNGGMAFMRLKIE